MSASDHTGRWARALAVPTALGLAALVSGCGSSSTTAGGMSCPPLVAAPGTATIAIFPAGGAKTPIVGGRIDGAQARCLRDKTGVAVNTEINFYAERINLQIKDATLPYFIALVDPQERVLAQEGFQLHVVFNPGENYRKLPPEKLTVHLPVRDRAVAADYSVIIGFQLTPEQLAFNRAALAH
jgi:hypothetical protein